MKPSPLIDGQRPRTGTVSRLNRGVQRILMTREEREEAELERRLRALRGVDRPNTVAVLSPSAGAGKTTVAFITATLLATHPKLRTIAVDAQPRFGTLAQLAPAGRRSHHGLDDLLREADRLHTAAELRRYVSTLPSGLHLLSAPRDPRAAARLLPDHYGELVALLSCFYDVVVLDVGGGVVGPMARFAAERADQLLLVTIGERLAPTADLGPLGQKGQRNRTMLVVNGVRTNDELVASLRMLAIPSDQQLAATLLCGTYSVDALRWPTRVAIKRLGLAVAEQLA